MIYLLQGLIDTNAAPLSSTFFPRTVDISPSSHQDCVCPGIRSRWDIMWSCFATILACSWASVHPNIPGPNERWWRNPLRRLELMFWSIISPELIIFWASRQWLSARHLAQKYSEDGWTITHGFFIQMGGFTLYDGEKSLGVLGPVKLHTLLRKKRITMPHVKEEEIKDRSKTDGLSKALVIVQTTWFIAHCVERMVRGLAITELELVTVAFAALNIIMYAFWRSKPFDVHTTIPVYLIQSDSTNAPASVNSTEERRLNSPESSPALASPRTGIFRVFSRPNLWNLIHGAWHIACSLLFDWPIRGIFALIRRIGEIWGNDMTGEGHTRTFSVYSASEIIQSRAYGCLMWALPFVGILFGTIHCVGWNFSFPSDRECNFWRFCSATITIVPGVGLVEMIIGKLDIEEEGGFDSFLLSQPSEVGLMLTIVMLPLYLFARLAILVQALMLLRNPQIEALMTVEWTSFIPHI
ncbi:hypothetical protein GALMADRAFT_72785 [Galerina marginata CBS 339.88]|uniref:Uncharacterized protein n=1 Tax=Galerina marginata (strain CBS 339.88) TaxID=685588 RepID=A0A067SQT1_GALM3|nr:hypothetical protein GALMADRAFT_72785 [Galerina marginata CBS 339.88]